MWIFALNLAKIFIKSWSFFYISSYEIYFGVFTQAWRNQLHQFSHKLQLRISVAIRLPNHILSMFLVLKLSQFVFRGNLRFVLCLYTYQRMTHAHSFAPSPNENPGSAPVNGVCGSCRVNWAMSYAWRSAYIAVCRKASSSETWNR